MMTTTTSSISSRRNEDDISHNKKGFLTSSWSLLRTFGALFAVSSLLAIGFLQQESNTLSQTFRIRTRTYEENDHRGVVRRGPPPPRNSSHNVDDASSSSSSSSFAGSAAAAAAVVPPLPTKKDDDDPPNQQQAAAAAAKDDSENKTVSNATAPETTTTHKTEQEGVVVKTTEAGDGGGRGRPAGEGDHGGGGGGSGELHASGLSTTTPLLVTTTTLADTDEGRGCRSLLTSLHSGNTNPHLVSPSVLWTLMKSQVLNASYYPPTEHGKSEAFRKYVNTIFTFYTSARLRRSTSHPAPVGSVRKLVSLVDNYKRQMEQYRHQRSLLVKSNASAANPNLSSLLPPPPEPIRILVLGGSVTKGTNALASSEVWLGRKPGTPESYYAWPARFEHMLNQLFFPNDDPSTFKGFSVNNYAMGATNSEVGAAMLNYQLIPGLDKAPPDIVIASYSTNDSRDPDRNATFHVHLQNLVHAAHATRPCDDDLPLVVLLDDMHGLLDEIPGLDITGSLFKLASWYNVLSVTYGNVARHASIASYFNVTTPNPLLGTAYDNLHHGVGMHIGIAWTLLYNVMAAFQDACADEVDPVMTDTMDSMMGSLVEPPTKYQGHISPMDQASLEWKDRIADKEKNCPMPYVEPAPYSTSVCAYAWTVNPITISEPPDIDNALRPVLVESNGWRADYFNNGTVFRSPGFGTETPLSNFSLVLRNVSQAIRSLTVFSMSSYGPGFANSLLCLNLRIERHNGGKNVTSVKGDEMAASYEVKGSHDLRTSVFFPHTFQLPGSGARIGDTIWLNASLASGRAFKIQAIAFCQS